MRGLSTREFQHDIGVRWPTGWFERVVIRRAARDYECDVCETPIPKGAKHGASRNGWCHVCLTCVTTRKGTSDATD